VTSRINLRSLESLKLSSVMYGRDVLFADFRLGGHLESGSTLRHLMLRDISIEGLDLAVDNVVALTLSGIADNGDDPNFWVRVLGSSERLDRLILSHLHYYRRGLETGGEPAIPVRAHLRSLVLGNGNGRVFFRYMIREIKAPALVSLDLCLPKCSEQYGRDIVTLIMEFFKSSPLVEDLTIRVNRTVAKSILNALRTWLADDDRASPANIYLPHLRYLKFDQLFEDHNHGLAEQFLDTLEGFFKFRSKVQYDDTESGDWRRKGSTHILKSLTLESFLHGQADYLEGFVQHFGCIPDWNPSSYEFHDLDERRSSADDGHTTWDELDYDSGDDDGLDAGSEEVDGDVFDDEEDGTDQDYFF